MFLVLTRIRQFFMKATLSFYQGPFIKRGFRAVRERLRTSIMRNRRTGLFGRVKWQRCFRGSRMERYSRMDLPIIFMFKREAARQAIRSKHIQAATELLGRNKTRAPSL